MICERIEEIPGGVIERGRRGVELLGFVWLPRREEKGNLSLLFLSFLQRRERKPFPSIMFGWVEERREEKRKKKAYYFFTLPFCIK